MTHREALTIAMREIGASEEAIKHAHLVADKNFIEQFGEAKLKLEIDKPVALLPGKTERDYIDTIKIELAYFSIMRAKDPKFITKEFARRKATLKKRLSGN